MGDGNGNTVDTELAVNGNTTSNRNLETEPDVNSNTQGANSQNNNQQTNNTTHDEEDSDDSVG